MAGFVNVLVIVQAFERVPVLSPQHFNPDINIGGFGVPEQINPAAISSKNIVYKVHTLTNSYQINAIMPAPAAQKAKSIFAIFLHTSGRK